MIDGALVPASVGGRLPSREPCVSSQDPPERRTSVDFISSAECIERRAGPAGRPARFAGMAVGRLVDAPRRTGTVGPAVRIAAAMGISAPDVPYLAHRRMAATPDENRAASDQAVLGYGLRCHRVC